MDKSIFSNISAQAQKLFNGAKSIFVEDSLLTNSFDKAINDYGSKHQSDYVKYLKFQRGIGDLDGLDRTTKYKGNVLDQVDEKIKFGAIEIDEAPSKKINNFVASKMAYESIGGIGTDNGIKKDYNRELKKAKRSITGHTAKNMLGNYYVSPLKNGVKSLNTTSFKDNKDLHKAIGRIGGAALVGGTAVGVVVADTRNDEDLERINNRLLSKYNSGEF